MDTPQEKALWERKRKKGKQANFTIQENVELEKGKKSRSKGVGGGGREEKRKIFLPECGKSKKEKGEEGSGLREKSANHLSFGPQVGGGGGK